MNLRPAKMGDLIKKPVKKKIKKSFLQKRKDDSKSGYWKKKADIRWREVINNKFNHECAVCGSGRNLEAHHLISRSHVLTRHEIRNGILLCSKHHMWDTELSPHGGPIGFDLWMQANIPVQLAWVRENRYRVKGEKPNYEEAYNSLNF